MQDNITIIDYGMGNLRSVEKKFVRVGAGVEITNNPNIIINAKKLVLPGVGHFANGVKKLKELGIWEVLNEKVLKHKTPILGICLGMQIMAKDGEEGGLKGLGWIDATVVKFQIKNHLRFKVPHMGWNDIVVDKESVLFQGVPEEAVFYFAHSYHIKCNNPKEILSTSDYEYNFTSSIQKDNIYGTQFHPEKSHDWGEIILRNFINI